jgi:hypothetical protein
MSAQISPPRQLQTGLAFGEAAIPHQKDDILLCCCCASMLLLSFIYVGYTYQAEQSNPTLKAVSIHLQL